MSSFESLELEVCRWADARGILKNGNPKTQMLKGASELGELADAIAKDDLNGIIDGIGDTIVVLAIVADMYSLSLKDCLQAAYDEIKDRKGYLNSAGVFVKEEQ